MRTSTPEERLRSTCWDWLHTLSQDEIRRRWWDSGPEGFYMNERLYLRVHLINAGLKTPAMEEHERQEAAKANE